jgi:hypothetical protein
MRFTVGGRNLELDRRKVLASVSNKEPELLREHYVEIVGENFPPKQVLALATGWERTSFTTMEATRVLIRLGFDCRRVDTNVNELTLNHEVGEVDNDRFTKSGLDEATTKLRILEAAVAGLVDRVNRLEDRT